MTDPATGPLQRFYEHGKAAGQRGEPLDACPYRRPDRVNAWVRGWHVGDDLRLKLDAVRERQAAARRASLADPGRSGGQWRG